MTGLDHNLKKKKKKKQKDPFSLLAFPLFHIKLYSVKINKLSQRYILRQPASADFEVLSTCYFKFIQQIVENLLHK